MVALVNPVQVEIALKVLRDVLVDALSDVITNADSIVLGTDAGGIPRAPRPILHIDLLNLPGMFRSFTDEKETKYTITNSKVTVLSAVDTRTYKVRVNGLPATHIAGAGSTVTTIRDGLKAQVALLALPVSLVDNGVDAFDVVPDKVGDTYSLTTPSATARLSVDNTVGTDCVTYVYGLRKMTARLQAQAKTGRLGSGGAHAVTSIAYAAVDMPDASLMFKDYRVSVKPLGTPQNISGQSSGGALMESRSFFDLDITLPSLFHRPASIIEIVELELSIGDDTVSFNVDVNNPP